MLLKAAAAVSRVPTVDSGVGALRAMRWSRDDCDCLSSAYMFDDCYSAHMLLQLAAPPMAHSQIWLDVVLHLTLRDCTLQGH